MGRSSRGQSADGSRVMRAAWRRSYPGLFMVLLFSVFVNLLKLATPLYVLQILDRIPASRSVETLVMLTAITVAAVLTGVVLEVVRRRMFMHWGTWIERHFGPKLVHTGLSTQTTDSATAPSKALRDLATIRQFVSGSGLLAWLDVVWAPLFVVVVYLIDPLLASIVLAAFVAVLALGLLQELMTRSAREASRRAQVDSRDWVLAAERNGETIGPLNMASSLAERWSESASERLDEGLRSRKLFITMAAAMRFLGRCLRIALLAFGIWLVIEDGLTLGAVVAAGVLGRMAYRTVEKAMLKWRELMVARRAYERVRDALGADTRRAPSMIDNKLPARLVIQDVGHRYASQPASVIKRLSLTLKPGEVLCVIGPSASGKTTFSRLASGLLKPRAGSIRLGDIDTSRLPEDGDSSHVGYLPQDVRLFRGTVRENIARMSQGDFGLVVEAAKLIGMHEVILRLPEGYDTEITEDEPLLSAGQRKGIALARALYGWPQLIVMDEPEPHVDRAARRVLVRALKTCTAQGSIVVVTSQSKILGRIADKVLLLGGPKVELLNDKDAIAALTRRRSRKKEATAQERTSADE
ncbi:MAG: type I secretion system permease/ATPase [Geminicoccaceae bacterium]